MNATSNNNTIINNEVSKPILKKLKEPYCSTSMSNKMNKATSNDNTMTNNATLPEWTLYRKFILYQFAKNVPDEGLRMNDDDMDEFTNRIFNTYNQDIWRRKRFVLSFMSVSSRLMPRRLRRSNKNTKKTKKNSSFSILLISTGMLMRAFGNYLLLYLILIL